MCFINGCSCVLSLRWKSDDPCVCIRLIGIRLNIKLIRGIGALTTVTHCKIVVRECAIASRTVVCDADAWIEDFSVDTCLHPEA